MLRCLCTAAIPLVLMLGLTGCGSGTSETPPVSSQPAGATDPNAVPPGMEPADPNLKKSK